MPLARSASTVKSAVRAISHGSRNSPNGTAKKRKASGNKITRAARQPASAGTESAISATSANWVTGLTLAKSPMNQTAATIETMINTSGAGDKAGSIAASALRCRQTSHAEIKGTM